MGRSITQKALLAVASMILVIVLAECALRLFAPIHFTGFTDAYQYDAELAYRAAPGHHLATTDYQQELYVNELGTINFQEGFQDYERLVYAIGDSFTQGTGLPADGSYPSQLDLMLNLDADGYQKRYGVVNLGLAAYGTHQELLTLQQYVERLGKPDYVLYVGCENDAVDDALFMSGVRHRNVVKGNPGYGLMYYPLNLVFYKSEVGKRMRYVVQEGFIRRGALRSAGQDETTVAERQEPAIDRIRGLADDCNARLIVTWSEPGDSYDWLKVWASERNVAFADWWPLVASTRESVPNLPLKNPHSGDHYRTWVNHVIARTFKDSLLTSLHPKADRSEDRL